MAARLNRYLERVAEVLAGEPANMIFPWSASRSVALPTFRDNTGFAGRCAIVGCMDFLKGIAKAGGIDFFEVGNGRPDTDYAGKGAKVLELLEAGYSFVVCHINSPDEAAHMHDRDMKIRCIGHRPACSHSRGGVPAVSARGAGWPDGRARSLHEPAPRTGAGRRPFVHPVPFVIWNDRDCDGVSRFDEESVREGRFGRARSTIWSCCGSWVGAAQDAASVEERRRAPAGARARFLPSEGVPLSGMGPLLLDLLYDPQFARDRVEILPWLLQIDAAHVVMLAERNILARGGAAGLLRVNRELAARGREGKPVIEPPPIHRGLYMVYERHYIDRLGPEVGGAAHSRNDINATIARVRLRSELIAVLEAGDALVGAALGLARDHAGTAMSGFTHFQPAQPTTFGHYLAGVASELLRSLDLLAGAFGVVNRSPLGAGAGLGTSFDIDRERTSSLLGFDGVILNSLDAVASRDYAVQVLAALSMFGNIVTRLSFDLQTWGSHAYGFLRWPDHLVSTSSMMPQKRNAFVLENIRGRAAVPAGALVAMLVGLKNTPFSNSVEVGSEATSHLWPALAAGRTMIGLTELVLREVEVDSGRTHRFLKDGETTMTALADHLVARHGLPFRTAHDAVGRLLQRAAPGELLSAAAVLSGLQEALRHVAGLDVLLDEGEVARALDPLAGVQASRHGGGPAPESVRAQLAELKDARQGLAARVTAWQRSLEGAEARLDEAVGSLMEVQG